MRLKKLVALVLAAAMSVTGLSELFLESVRAKERNTSGRAGTESDIIDASGENVKESDASGISVDAVGIDDIVSDGNGFVEEPEVYTREDETLSGIALDSSTSYSSPYSNSNGDTVWDCVWFGNYWQNDTNRDGTADMNDAKEPIKWRVLYASSDDLFLLSEKLLDVNPYNTTDIDITWEKSTIRSWLNGYDSSYNTCGTNYTDYGFINAAFSDSEMAAIKTSTVNNANSQGYYNTYGGKNTYDKLYLLSYKETVNGSYGFSTDYGTYDWARRAKFTPFAKARGAYVNTDSEYAGNGWWWLRSPGYTAYSAAGVTTYGYAGDYYNVYRSDECVRPALHISPSSPFISYAGTVCSDGTENEISPGQTAVFSVSFDSNGGSAVSSRTAESGSKISKPSDPVRDGYTFVGWYKDSALTQAWNFNSDSVTSNITLYAKWAAAADNKYKLIDTGLTWNEAESYCESMGGHLAIITTEEEQKIIENLLQGGTKNSYWIGGYKSGNSWVWLNGEKFSYTNWAPGQPDNNTSSGKGENHLMIYRVANPNSKGSAFGLWNDLYHNGTCGTQPFFGLDDFGFICEFGNSDIEVYTVTFDTQGGSAVESQKVPGNSKAVKPSNPTRSGYTFGGWYKDSALTKAWDFNKDLVTSDITLYAKWEINSGEDDDAAFVIGQDNNHFGHYKSNFFTGENGTYHFKNAYYYSELEKLGKESLQNRVTREWGGSCFGIASTIGLVETGKLSISDITDSNAAYYHDLQIPLRDPVLFDSINYYQTGYPYVTKDAKIASTAVDSLKVFLKALVQNTKNEKPVIFCYYYYSTARQDYVGHAILALDSEFDENNNQYIVTLYDENTASGTAAGGAETERKSELTVSSDYSSFSYLTSAGFMLENEYLNMELFDLAKFPLIRKQPEPVISSDSTKVTISLPFGKETKITDSNGKSLTVTHSGVENTMNVYNIQYICADDASRIEITVDRNAQYTIRSNDIDVSITGKDIILSVKGKGANGAILSLKDGTIKIEGGGSRITFGGYIMSDSGALMSLNGNTTGDTLISIDNNTIKASTNGKLSDIKSVTYRGNEMSNEEVVISDDGNAQATEKREGYVTVTFNSNGGSSVSSQMIPSGGSANKPSNPIKSGYTFAGWYVDSNLTVAWDFSRTISEDVTLYARWEKGSYRTISVGKKTTYKVKKKVAKVEVSDKSVVKVKKHGKKVIVKGKRSGMATITAYDKKGKELGNWTVEVN